MYTDARQKHVTVPGLAVGDAIEYNAVTTSSPIIAGQFWYTWAFVAGAVSLDEQVELNVPRDRALKIKSPPGVEPIVRDDLDPPYLSLVHFGPGIFQRAELPVEEEIRRKGHARRPASPCAPSDSLFKHFNLGRRSAAGTPYWKTIVER